MLQLFFYFIKDTYNIYIYILLVLVRFFSSRQLTFTLSSGHIKKDTESQNLSDLEQIKFR